MLVKLSRYFVKTKAPPSPNATPIKVRLKPCPENHPEDLAAAGAQGHADSNLVCTLGHRVSHDTVESDRSELLGQETEKAQQLCKQSFDR